MEESKPGLGAHSIIEEAEGKEWSEKEAEGSAPSIHIVQDDDTLEGIALRYDMSVQALRRANALRRGISTPHLPLNPSLNTNPSPKSNHGIPSRRQHCDRAATGSM